MVRYLTTAEPYSTPTNPTSSTALALEIYILTILAAASILHCLHHFSLQKNCQNYTTPTIHWWCHPPSVLNSPPLPHCYLSAPNPLYHSFFPFHTSTTSTCLPSPLPPSYLQLRTGVIQKWHICQKLVHLLHDTTTVQLLHFQIPCSIQTTAPHCPIEASWTCPNSPSSLLLLHIPGCALPQSPVPSLSHSHHLQN